WATIIGFGFASGAVFFAYLKGIQAYFRELKIQVISLIFIIPLIIVIAIGGKEINIHWVLFLFSVYALSPLWFARKVYVFAFKKFSKQFDLSVKTGLKQQLNYFLVEFQSILLLNLAFFILGTDSTP